MVSKCSGCQSSCKIVTELEDIYLDIIILGSTIAMIAINYKNF